MKKVNLFILLLFFTLVLSSCELSDLDGEDDIVTIPTFTELNQDNVQDMLEFMYGNYNDSKEFTCSNYFADYGSNIADCQAGFPGVFSPLVITDIKTIKYEDDHYVVIPYHDYGGDFSLLQIFPVYEVWFVLEEESILIEEVEVMDVPTFAEIDNAVYEMLYDLQSNEYVDPDKFCDFYDFDVDNCFEYRNNIVENELSVSYRLIMKEQFIGLPVYYVEITVENDDPYILELNAYTDDSSYYIIAYTWLYEGEPLE